MYRPEEDTEHQQWVVRFPFQKYYSILEVSYIIQRATPQIYGEIRHGLVKAVLVDGTICLTHEEVRRQIENRRIKSPDLVQPYVPEDLQGVEESKQHE